jgi:acyl carrier protein
MSDKPTIQSRITEILCNQLCLNANQVTLTSSIRYDLGADSLDAVEIIMALEDEFKIELNEADCNRVEAGAITDLVAVITTRTSP